MNLKNRRLYMKATGIVRRIDDLGRVVIPKEIRRTMRIREGDPLEIYTDREGEVIFKKYSPIGELNSFASQYADTLHKTCDLCVVITDRDAVIAVSGAPKKEFADKSLSAELDSIINARGFYAYDGKGKRVYVTDNQDSGYFVSAVMPIITEGDITGSVVSLIPDGETASKVGSELESKLIQTAAGFLSKQLES
jgi:transcriptional regulator, abrB family